jgi:hypothetical protein
MQLDREEVLIELLREEQRPALLLLDRESVASGKPEEYSFLDWLLEVDLGLRLAPEIPPNSMQKKKTRGLQVLQ